MQSPTGSLTALPFDAVFTFLPLACAGNGHARTRRIGLLSEAPNPCVV